MSRDKIIIVALVVLPFCTSCIYIPFTSPPDLSRCTRLEIRYDPSTLDYFLPSGLQNILSPEEKKYIQSLKIFVVSDHERIKAFAKDVSSGTYEFHLWAKIPYFGPVYVDCYRGNKHVIFFGVFGNEIITNGWSWFKYPLGSPNLELIEPPEIRPFKLRGDCAWNMERLHTAGPLDRRDVNSYPEPDQWCDAIVGLWRNEYFVDEHGIKKRSHSEEWICSVFTCPSVREGKCHYAMNPNCRPNSPPDTVLLFETKAGWNQHGGPELFTFDNHDPKGGCVLLNDGTVKFIRTKEELQQLRWK